MQPAEEMVDGGNDLSKVRGSNPIFCQIQNFWQEYWPWHAKKVYQTQTKHRPKTEITKRRNAHFTHFNQNFQCSPPCQILRTNHPMVETPPPLTGYQQRNARMSALLIPLIVRWREWFLIGVVLLLLLLPQAKKSAKKAWRRWWSTNIFQSKRVLDRDPDLPLQIEDTYCPPNTLCDGGGGGGGGAAATVLCAAAATTLTAARLQGRWSTWGGHPSRIERKGGVVMLEDFDRSLSPISKFVLGKMLVLIGPAAGLV